ncbi:MAG TPA: YicC family protein [Clostridiales bacterium]|nr:YicC family protein [Clostridiales bacterium]
MVSSMTGYGLGESSNDKTGFRVEIKAVNHRFSDILVKMPRQLNSLEERVRKMTAQTLVRGRIEIYISFDNASALSKEVILDEALLRSYMRALDQINLLFPDLVRDDSVSLVASWPDILRVDNPALDGEDAWQCLEPALQQALAGVQAMRSQEGLRLAVDIRVKISSIMQARERVALRAPFVVQEYKTRLENRISELTSQTPLDEARLAAEVAYFADRAAIDEELVRLESHCRQMMETLDDTGQIGRKLDFIVQEMNREANTIGSKSNDLDITKDVILIKNEIEKIKEQVQNIE